MPQVFIVVRCFDCDTFQVQQSKKTPKWSCKMCGQKQSVKKVYGKGGGADCRKLVQSLNLTAGELMESRKTSPNVVEDDARHHEEEAVDDLIPATSRWTNFLEESEQTELEDSSTNTEEPFNVVTERPHPTKRRCDINSFSKKQRFPKKITHWQSFSYSKSADENIESEKYNRQELLSSSSSSSHLDDADDFGEGTDFFGSSRQNFFNRATEDNKSGHLGSAESKHKPLKLSVRTHLEEGILQERIPQQANVDAGIHNHKQSFPLKRKRQYETKVQKETSVGCNSKWDMFLTAKIDDCKEEEENQREDFVEPGWCGTDLTSRQDDYNGTKIFQTDDGLEDDLSWYD